MEILKLLFDNRDLKYRDFHSKLMPTIDKDAVIGVRVPVLRKLTKEFYKSGTYIDFMKALPHRYYEENNVHAFLIECITDFDKCVEEINRFLPYVDNWATCDMMKPRCFEKNKPRLLKEIKKWMNSGETYTVRFAIGMLMSFYLDEDFDESLPCKVASVKSDEYYVNMMIAWYFATALSKRWDDIFPYIKEGRLSLWIHNKTIQKAIESYRITNEQKELLKTYRIKNKE